MYVSRWIIAFCLWLQLTSAQSTFSNIVGRVTDPSDAVVQRAKVTVLNKATRIERSLLTVETGEFLAANLDPGIYSVSVEASGFQKLVREDVEVLARQQVRLDVRLELAGSAGERVEVTASAGVINTETPTLADSKSGREINELALNFRASSKPSPLQIATLAPGVQQDRSNQISVAGMQPYSTSVTLDGISTLNARLNGPVAELFPSVESIQEFKVSALNNNAEFAQASDITITSRSGSNDFHGAAYWFHQNKALNATNPFAPVDPARPDQRLKPSLVANAFGGAVGGPVWIPRGYNGRNRTFFFFDYEGVRLPSQTTLRQVVPPDAFRRGDLSSVATPIRDPQTGAPFPGNQIPVNSVAAKALDRLYERQNQPTGSSLSAPNFITNVPGNFSVNGFDVRGDHAFTERHKVFARYTRKRYDQTGAFASNYNTKAGIYSRPIDVDNLAGSWNWIVRPNVMNEFRSGLSLSKFNNTYPLAANGKQIIQELGITNLPANPPQGGLPYFAFTDGSITVASSPGLTNPIESKTYLFNDNLTWIKGRHTIKAGVDVQHLIFRDISTYNTGDDYGEYYFASGAAGVDSYSGYAFADFLLGLPRQTAKALNGPDFNPYTTNTSLFVQDDWRISPRLTLNAGVRYEIHPPFNDKTRQLANFDRAWPGGRVVVQDTSLIAPAFQRSIGNTPIVSNKDAGLPDTLRFTDWNNVNPRIGLAYRPFKNNRTVIRSGFGVYTITILGRVLYSLEGVANGSFLSFTNISPAAVRQGATPLRLPNVFPQGTGDDPGLPDYRRANAFHFSDPYSMQWNLTIEQDLGWSTGLRVSYTGQRQIDLVHSPDINQVRPNTQGYEAVRNQRPYPNFNVVLDRDNALTGKYHALTTELSKRFSDGLSFQTSWVWAKNLSNANGPAPTGFSAENGPDTLDRFDFASQYGSVAFTRRHRFLTTFVWELPLGRNRRFLSQLSRPADMLVGGWQLAGFLTLQTGPFLTPFFSGGSDPSGTGVNVRGHITTQRPDRVSAGEPSNPVPEAWFDRSAFVIPANNIGRFGNSGVGILTGPGTRVFSMSAAKRFALTERVALRYESTFTNLFNHTNYDIPGTMNISSGSFGQINATQPVDWAGPRTIQMSLRVIF